MKTRGTANLDLLTDGELKHLLAACCLDVYEGAVLGDEELEFALGTLDRFMAERQRRIAASRPILSIGDTDDRRSRFDPNNPETRAKIDAFKATRLQSPYRMAAYQQCVENPDVAFEYWIEQIGDAELYERAAGDGG